MAAERVITYEELMQHQEKDNLWLLLHGKGTLYTWGFSLLSHLEIVCMDVHLVLPYKFPLLTLAPAADSDVQFTTWPSSSTRQVKLHHGCSYFPPLHVFILPLSTLVGKKSSSQKLVSTVFIRCTCPVLTPYGNRQGRNRILRGCRPLRRGP